MDAFKNFANGVVSTGYDDNDTSIVMTTGHTARFPAAPFYAVWYNHTDYPEVYGDPNKEIVRVTAISAETWTIIRGRDGTTGSSKNTGGKEYRVQEDLIAADVAQMRAILEDRFWSDSSFVEWSFDGDNPTPRSFPISADGTSGSSGYAGIAGDQPRGFGINGSDPRKIDWSKPLTVNIRMTLSSTDAAGVFLFFIGNEFDGEPPLETKGIGFVIENESLKIIAHDGSDLTTSSALATISAAWAVRQFTLIHDGSGTVAIMVDGVAVGSSGGGPTTLGDTDMKAITFFVENTDDGNSVTATIHNISMMW